MSAHQPSPATITAAEALTRLKDGNARFLRGEAQLPTAKNQILAELAREQRPFAAVLGCSDSRVPPELLFDVGFGELFVIRVAGNVLSPEVMASMQYAGAHLNTPLFVVLGHEGCGAVNAALETKFEGVEHLARIAMLARGITPALEGIDANLPPDERLAQAVEANVRWSIDHLRDTPEGRARAEEGHMKLVGAICEIKTGRVRFLE